MRLVSVSQSKGRNFKLKKRGENRKIRAELLRTSGSKHMEQVIWEGSGSTEHKLIQETPRGCRMQ